MRRADFRCSLAGSRDTKDVSKKEAKHCSRVFMDGGVWEVISANNDSARMMNGVLTRILDLNDIEELSKIMPILLPTECYSRQ
jgi:hypothetical protein